jgi:hypothetical protein
LVALLSLISLDLNGARDCALSAAVDKDENIPVCPARQIGWGLIAHIERKR